MNELIIYSAECLSCRYRTEMQQIRQFAHKHHYKIESKRTNYSRANDREAKDIGSQLPFIKLGDRAVSFKGITSGILEELV